MALNITLPNWLQSPVAESGRLYASGMELGAKVAMERARAQEAAAQHEAELAARSAALQQEAQYKQQAMQNELMMNQQKLLIDKAYKDTLTGINQDKFGLEVMKQKAKAEEAAALFAAQQSAGAMFVEGKPIEDVLFANPRLLSPGVISALTRAGGEGKDYGAPIYEDIPGMPGSKAAYRKGSPGVHIITPPKEPALTKHQRAGLIGRLISAKRAYAEIPADDPTRQEQADYIKQLEELMKETPAAAPPAPVPVPVPRTTAPVTRTQPAVTRTPAAAPRKSSVPYPEGTVLRKKDGSRWLVTGGELVPYTETGNREER